ncbi:MAG: hypothetical protein JWP64_3538 [Pseudonocardia sp.]|jgi:hypothetical protein|uniref:hypothetical protein n=1 Tax=Pseudonocardia sp. TaxID=60912 RepID=UPI0026386CE7|nr:hypothetical protein [Pseudonocardia sp.]MCU1628589.1 hypothetical protein [Pseudonocardia sp.]MDT7701076.1 hypothetical protein [Pseudonocardiales bacterium]
MNEILTAVGAWTGILVIAVLAVTPLLADLPNRRRPALPAHAVPHLPAQRAAGSTRPAILTPQG